MVAIKKLRKVVYLSREEIHKTKKIAKKYKIGLKKEKDEEGEESADEEWWLCIEMWKYWLFNGWHMADQIGSQSAKTNLLLLNFQLDSLKLSFSFDLQNLLALPV